MSPPSAKQKRKPTQLDYTDDISVGSTRPSPSPKAKTHSAPTKTPRSPPPSPSPLLSSPQIQLDELGTPIHSKPKRSFLSATTTTAATTITTGTAATAAAPKITAATTSASHRPPRTCGTSALSPWLHLYPLLLPHVSSKCFLRFHPFQKQVSPSHNGYNTPASSYP